MIPSRQRMNADKSSSISLFFCASYVSIGLPVSLHLNTSVPIGLARYNKQGEHLSRHVTSSRDGVYTYFTYASFIDVLGWHRHASYNSKGVQVVLTNPNYVFLQAATIFKDSCLSSFSTVAMMSVTGMLQ